MLRPPFQTDPVFETGAASLYLPAFQKLAARVGLAPTPNGLIPMPNRDYFDTVFCGLDGSFKLAARAGIAPAQSG